jgi:hypothetical protein
VSGGFEPCRHFNFEVLAEVARLLPLGATASGDPTVEPTGYSLSLRVLCSDCREPFVFRGLPVGLSPVRPMTSVDGLELRAPLTPQRDGSASGHDGVQLLRQPNRRERRHPGR